MLLVLIGLRALLFIALAVAYPVTFAQAWRKKIDGTRTLAIVCGLGGAACLLWSTYLLF